MNIAALSGTGGAIWGAECEDLNATIVRWSAERGVDHHVNGDFDVVMAVLEGSGSIRIDGQEIKLDTGAVQVIPKGSTRSILAGEGGMTYVNVHKRKPRLMPNMERPK